MTPRSGPWLGALVLIVAALMAIGWNWQARDEEGAFRAEATLLGKFILVSVAAAEIVDQPADLRPQFLQLELLERGPADRVFRAIYQRTHEGTPRGIAAALAGTEYLADGAAVVGSVTEEELAQAGGTLVDTDDVLDILRAVGSVEVVAFLSERGGRVKVSFRSKTTVDVNLVARQCGGGGHARAAGATFPQGVSMSDAKAQVAQLLEQAVAASA